MKELISWRSLGKLWMLELRVLELSAGSGATDLLYAEFEITP